jgi:hypothetical protein
MKLSKHISNIKEWNVFIYGVDRNMNIIKVNDINEIEGQANIDCDWELILAMTKFLYHKNEIFKSNFEDFVKETRENK